MDEKLKHLLKIKQLQTNLALLRTEVPEMYEKRFESYRSVQMERLLKVQMDIPVTEIAIPDPSVVPASNQKIQPTFKTTDIENDCKDLQKIFDFI